MVSRLTAGGYVGHLKHLNVDKTLARARVLIAFGMKYGIFLVLYRREKRGIILSTHLHLPEMPTFVINFITYVDTTG